MLPKAAFGTGGRHWRRPPKGPEAPHRVFGGATHRTPAQRRKMSSRMMMMTSRVPTPMYMVLIHTPVCQGLVTLRHVPLTLVGVLGVESSVSFSPLLARFWRLTTSQLPFAFCAVASEMTS